MCHNNGTSEIKLKKANSCCGDDLCQKDAFFYSYAAATRSEQTAKWKYKLRKPRPFILQ